LQNAFLPVGCGSLPPNVLEPVVGPLSIDPQRLLTYFNGVLQFGQGLGFWSDASLAAAEGMVGTYKSVRKFMDPATSNYYRLFQSPTPGDSPQPADITGFSVGYIFEDRTTHAGFVFLMAQSGSPSPIVTVRCLFWNGSFVFEECF
jgi:hypothetical protein